MMKKITLLFTLLTVAFGFSQNTVTVDVGASWTSYMNVFDTGGGYLFGQGGAQWTIPNLKTTIGASTITLQPNFNAYSESLAGNNGDRAYWTNSSDGGVTAGPTGNKLMEASTFVEPGPTFNGVDLTFTGNVVSNTLSSSINGGYTAKFFIKALDPNCNYCDALGGAKVIDLPASGVFTVSATAAELATGLIVQYGFRIYGLNANPDDEAALGSVVVEAVSLSTKDFQISGLNVYPNPTKDSWTIKTNNERISSIQVYDILGKSVLSLTPNNTEVKIDATTLKSGLYFAKISTDNGSSSMKLINN